MVAVSNKSVLFVRHCEEENCDLGYVVYCCPVCNQNVQDFDVWFQRGSLELGNAVYFQCVECKGNLELKLEDTYIVSAMGYAMQGNEELAANYEKYRGKCKEMSEELVKADPTLRLVRGFYHCPVWGKQPHWWTAKPDGTITDPTALQFPSAGHGSYEEFDGFIECDECGKKVPEAEAHIAGNGHYAFCSCLCEGKFIGVL